MRLEGKKVYLYPFSKRELSSGNYINWLNDKEVCKYNSHGETEYTYNDAISFLESLFKDDSKKNYAVYLISNDVHIGNISLQCIDKKNYSAEIALLFGERIYWGKGYATDALNLIIKEAKKMNLHRLYFGTHPENVAMQKLGIKFNFIKEGVLKDAQFKNGKYNDIFIYGLII